MNRRSFLQSAVAAAAAIPLNALLARADVQSPTPGTRVNNVVLRGERNGLSGNFTSSEWSGPCYSPDGNWLFANIYDPGITVAITGPWQTGAL